MASSAAGKFMYPILDFLGTYNSHLLPTTFKRVQLNIWNKWMSPKQSSDNNGLRCWIKTHDFLTFW